jgi:hypothetical protein
VAQFRTSLSKSQSPRKVRDWSPSVMFVLYCVKLPWSTQKLTLKIESRITTTIISITRKKNRKFMQKRVDLELKKSLFIDRHIIRLICMRDKIHWSCLKWNHCCFLTQKTLLRLQYWRSTQSVFFFWLQRHKYRVLSCVFFFFSSYLTNIFSKKNIYK